MVLDKLKKFAVVNKKIKPEDVRQLPERVERPEYEIAGFESESDSDSDFFDSSFWKDEQGNPVVVKRVITIVYT